MCECIVVLIVMLSLGTIILGILLSSNYRIGLLSYQEQKARKELELKKKQKALGITDLQYENQDHWDRIIKLSDRIDKLENRKK